MSTLFHIIICLEPFQSVEQHSRPHPRSRYCTSTLNISQSTHIMKKWSRFCRILQSKMPTFWYLGTWDLDGT